jgi:hypothetical protein
MCHSDVQCCYNPRKAAHVKAQERVHRLGTGTPQQVLLQHTLQLLVLARRRLRSSA